ncbi:LuxR C-terminal-related transcriptional regulator [Streptomyces phaeochromogenes]|uniref:helix-turn-helix domain-containing protein n=1 Tax=Streptomyces phaeochromogenes TaxID=1923 RepID=UPI003863EAE9
MPEPENLVRRHQLDGLLPASADAGPVPHQTSGLDPLTGREHDVFIAVASGWSNAEITERLPIAPATVKGHVSNILAKIGARARVQAVAFGYESGLIRPAA